MKPTIYIPKDAYHTYYASNPKGELMHINPRKGITTSTHRTPNSIEKCKAHHQITQPITLLCYIRDVLDGKVENWIENPVKPKRVKTSFT